MNRQLNDVLEQPLSLIRVLEHQFGYGAADRETCASAIRAARNVIFTGMGSSLFAAIPAVHMLNDAGILAQAIETSELLYFGRGLLQPGTAVVLVSRSGESVETTKLLPLVRDARAQAIAVTNVPNSTLWREVSTRLLIGSEPDLMVAIKTYTATVVVLLLVAMQALNRPAGSDISKLLLHAMSDMQEAALKRNDSWREFLEPASVVYLLGRGPSMASVHEAALLFNEAARTPSVAMSAAQFRHGPVEAVNDYFRAIMFASQPATAELERALANDITTIGGGVEIVAAPAGCSPFEPVLEIIPVQIAVCALAESAGIEPGDFQYAGQITKSETGFRSNSDD